MFYDFWRSWPYWFWILEKIIINYHYNSYFAQFWNLIKWNKKIKRKIFISLQILRLFFFQIWWNSKKHLIKWILSPFLSVSTQWSEKQINLLEIELDFKYLFWIWNDKWLIWVINRFYFLESRKFPKVNLKITRNLKEKRKKRRKTHDEKGEKYWIAFFHHRLSILLI